LTVEEGREQQKEDDRWWGDPGTTPKAASCRLVVQEVDFRGVLDVQLLLPSAPLTQQPFAPGLKRIAPDPTLEHPIDPKIVVRLCRHQTFRFLKPDECEHELGLQIECER
jgi:hypothetical protein